MTENEFVLSEIETDDPLSGDEKRAMKTARDFLGGMSPSEGQRISIIRTRPGWIPGGGGWLETVDFSPTGCEFSLEGLRETYGGGTYVLKVLNEKGKFLAAQTVKIAGDPIHQGRRITQQMVEASLMPQVSTAPAVVRDTEMADLVKALLANSSKAQRDSFDLLVSLWTNQAKPQGQPTSFDELSKMIKFVDDIRGGQQPAEDSTLSSMMGLLSQFMASKQATPPPMAVSIPQQRAPMKFIAPPVMSAKSQAVNPVPIMNNPVNTAPVMSAQSQPVPTAPVMPAPVVPAHSPVMPMDDDLENDPLEGEEIDIADDIASWPVDEIVQLIADVMAKIPETKTLELMEKMKTT